ncbi:MAG: protein translocase subunit SecD [Burkholderiaceae bacterium]|nr:protein translocase subunit SecD [Burkholderiaceae bacterium]
MNRYALWKYILIAVAVLLGTLYTAPNFFPEAPAVQVTSAKATIKVDTSMTARVDDILKKGGIKADDARFDLNGSQGSVRVRFATVDAQFSAKSLLEKELNPDQNDHTYSVTFNSLPSSPAWLQSLHALPMYLGLDLRGGVHFLMQVDTAGYLKKRQQGQEASIRTLLRDKSIRHAGIAAGANGLEIKFRDEETRQKAKDVLSGQMRELTFVMAGSGSDLVLQASMNPQKTKEAIDEAVVQNIVTLSKRVNELGLSEPIIQRQGLDRIVVELPGVVDVARAKDIIGRTATLEIRMVDESIVRGTELTSEVPAGSELFTTGRDAPVILYKDAVVTGDYISSADARPDQQNGLPVVSISLNSEGGHKMFEGTRGKVGKLMAVVLFEKGKGEVLTVARIQQELGANFQITGERTMETANDLALLLRAGSLAAPMDIIGERTVGPQLGAENIKKGFDSTLYGFAAIAAFMIIYYMVFGFFSVLALAINLLLLVGLLSGMHVTLTLPGMAAIALALGMAIDANVLINERVREELRNGNTPQASIAMGFDRAWATILDSNITTLIVGLALLSFGSGPIRGFAIVHCLGILTSIFSAVFVSRGVVNLWYGRQKKLTSVKIGQIWKPTEA